MTMLGCAVILITFISIHGQPPCESLDRVMFPSIDNLSIPATLAFLDSHGLPGDVMRSMLKHFDYLLLHQILWMRKESSFISRWWFLEGGLVRFKIRQLSLETPSIEDPRLIGAIGTDLRMVLRQHDLPRAPYIRATLDNFDFPSKLLLYIESRRYRENTLVDILWNILREDIVPWLRVRDDKVWLDTRENLFSRNVVLNLAYDVLSSLPVGQLLGTLQNLDYFALARLAKYANSRIPLNVDVSRAIDNAISNRRFDFAVWLRQDAHEMTEDLVNARDLIFVLRAIPRLDITCSLPTLLKLGKSMRTFHAEVQESGMRKSPNQDLVSSASQYAEEYSVTGDLEFLRDVLVDETLAIYNPVDFRVVFRDEQSIADMYHNYLRHMNSDRLRFVFDRFDYHHLFKMQKVLGSDPVDAKIYNTIDEYCDALFKAWLRRDGGFGHMAPYVVPSDKSDVFFDPQGAKNVYERLLRHFGSQKSALFYSKLLRDVDYRSLLLLREAVPRREVRSPVARGISYLLPKEQRTFLRWLNSRDPFSYTQGGKVEWDAIHKFVIALLVLPDSEVTHFLLHIRDMKSLMRRWLTEDSLTDKVMRMRQYESAQRLLLKAINAFASRRFKEIRGQDIVSCLHQLASQKSIREALKNFDYNQLLVLQNIDVAQFGVVDGNALQTVLSDLLKEKPGAYYHQLEPKYLAKVMKGHLEHAEATRTTLESMQYLPLLSLIQEEASIGEMVDIHIIQKAKMAWRRWFDLHSPQVIANPAEMSKLLDALLLVPQDEYLLAPPQISQLGDKMREWYPGSTSLRGYSKFWRMYQKFVRHAKKYRRFSDGIGSSDMGFRNHIWLHETDVDHPDALTASVWFDKEVLTTQRSNVYDAISWPSVVAHSKALGTRYHEVWPVPDGLATDSSGKFIFLVDDKKESGLPSAWFAYSDWSFTEVTPN